MTKGKKCVKHSDKTACPFVNTLLNEKLIPETNISNDEFMNAIKKHNIFDPLFLFVLENGIIKPALNSNGIITNIQVINKLFEHDISLSRIDSFQGDSVPFNKKHFQKLKNKSVDKKYLTLENFADFRKDLIIQSRKKNPQFNFGIKAVIASCAEDAFLSGLFSDETGNMKIDWLEYFFSRAKLPFKLGYTIKQVSTINIVKKTIIQINRLIPSIV
jgi:hypothetical protein